MAAQQDNRRSIQVKIRVERRGTGRQGLENIMTKEEIWELREGLKNIENRIFASEMSCTLSNELVRLRKLRNQYESLLADEGIFT